MATKQPPPPPSVLTTITTLDSTLSLKIHTIAAPLIPRATLKLLELTGDGRLWFPLTLSLLLLTPTPTLPLLLLSGLTLDLAAVGLLKHLTRRPRPSHNHHSSMSPSFSVDRFSFPSGHSSRAFFLSSLLHLEIPALVGGLDRLRTSQGEDLDRWIGERDSGEVVRAFVVAVWVWSLLTSSSRVLLGRHYVLDVFVGACLGVANGLFVHCFLRF